LARSILSLDKHAMTIVIGLAPGERGDAAALLGVMLANAAGEDLLVAAVTPTPWPANPQDEEFRVTQERLANRALDRARDVVQSRIPASYVVHPARSVATGLNEIVHQHATSVVVLGSSARGLVGLVSLGGVAERLLHSLETPVCIAPVGFDSHPTARLTRVTVGYGRADHDSGLLSAAAVRADELGLRLRVACFAVRPTTAEGGSIEKEAETLVVDEWADQLRSDISRSLTSAGYDPARVEMVIGPGATLGEAVGGVPWDPGDLLVIGASASTVSRFFLGSHASKIVRSSPVPVLVLARSGLR
jgi:nucleotide-binding universal stress UspA family protein